MVKAAAAKGWIDGDGKARDGDRGAGAQGGGALEAKDGGMSQRGDTGTVDLYGVGGLFDTSFGNFNRFHEQGNAGTHGGGFAAQLLGKAMIFIEVSIQIDLGQEQQGTHSSEAHYLPPQLGGIALI